MPQDKESLEKRVLQYAITLFWMFYWLLNVIDKFIADPRFLWVGKDRMLQFINYFGTIGIANPSVALIVLVFVTLLEIVAFALITLSLVNLVRKKMDTAYKLYFWGTITGMGIFTIFSIGDQVFGDRAELWEHTTFWIAILVSFAFYRYYQARGV